MASRRRRARAGCTSCWQPLAASFARSAPPDPAPWRRRFGPGVVFDREFTGLVLPARDLAAPTLPSDASLRPYTQEFLRTIVAARAPDGVASVTDVEEAVVEARIPDRRPPVLITAILVPIGLGLLCWVFFSLAV